MEHTTLGLEYNEAGNKHLIGYSDADWGGDLAERKSTSGYVFLLAGGAISWSSKKQSTVALSTTEAEYIAMCHASKEAIWLRQLLADINYKILGPTSIYGDNQGCIALSKNPSDHARTKHMDIKYHFVREKVEQQKIVLSFCPSEDMAADAFTKGLTKEKHQRLIKKIGTTNIS